jgi:protein-tyrosine phosphatase
MAEGIFKDMMDPHEHEVSSAGFLHMQGEEASPNAVKVCAGHGIDLSHHTSTFLGNSQVAKMDLVLTATERHRDDLADIYPDLEIATIKEYAEGYDDIDIADPIIGDEDVYEECFLEIEEALKKVNVKLKSKKSPDMD